MQSVDTTLWIIGAPVDNPPRAVATARHRRSVTTTRIIWPRPSRTRDRRPVPTDASGVFTRDDARRAGWSDAAARHALATGRWLRLKPGVFVTASSPGPQTSAERARAANLRLALATARRCPRAALSHSSAAILHGLPTVCSLTRPCLTVPAGTALRDLADVHLHRATLPTGEVLHIDDSRVTSVARTVLDLAREHGVDAGVAAADAALRRGSTTAELRRVLAGCANWPGRAAARATVQRSDGLAESPLESVSRLRIGDANLPRPRLQVELGDERGWFVARTDFYWPEFGVVGEADGNIKYDAAPALIAERRRQAALEDLGLVVVRWGWADLDRFDIVVRRLRAAFTRGIPTGGGQRWSVLSPCTRVGA
jgi:hypothetical protein